MEDIFWSSGRSWSHHWDAQPPSKIQLASWQTLWWDSALLWGSMQPSMPKGAIAHRTHNPCSLSVFTSWEQRPQQTLVITVTSSPDSVFSIWVQQHKNNTGTMTVLLKLSGLQWDFSPVEALGPMKLIVSCSWKIPWNKTRSVRFLCTKYRASQYKYLWWAEFCWHPTSETCHQHERSLPHPQSPSEFETILPLF